MSATEAIGNDKVDKFLHQDFVIYWFHPKVSNHLVIADHDRGFLPILNERTYTTEAVVPACRSDRNINERRAICDSPR